MHTDDVNMAGQSNAVMKYILKVSNDAWKVKEVDPAYMLGVQHLFSIDKGGVWCIEHKMPLYIEGLVLIWSDFLDLAGFGKRSPKTPAPSKIVLSLHDPLNMVSTEESTLVLKRGYANLAGGLIWPIKNVYHAGLYAVSNITTVMSKPSEEAWSYAMHTLAWLRGVADEGLKFRGDDPMPMHAFVDASLEIDIGDGRVRAGHTIRLAGGPIISRSSKLQRVSKGIPGAEYMQIRNCGADIMWLRDVLCEMGLHIILPGPTEMHSDSTGAMDWAKFGRLTQANKHLALAYYEVQEWVQNDYAIILMKIASPVNLADFLTKNPTLQMVRAFVRWLHGHEIPPEEFFKGRAEQIAKIQREQIVFKDVGTVLEIPWLCPKLE